MIRFTRAALFMVALVLLISCQHQIKKGCGRPFVEGRGALLKYAMW